MHDGLPDRHFIAVHGFFDGRHFRAARTQQPPADGGDRGTCGDGNRTTNSRYVERAGFMCVFHIAKRNMLDAVQHEREESCAYADCGSDNDHRRDQRCKSANQRLLRLSGFIGSFL